MEDLFGKEAGQETAPFKKERVNKKGGANKYGQRTAARKQAISELGEVMERVQGTHGTYDKYSDAFKGRVVRAAKKALAAAEYWQRTATLKGLAGKYGIHISTIRTWLRQEAASA